MKVADILQSRTREPYTAAPDTLLSDCVIGMADEDLGSIVVTEAGRVVGLLTFREVIQVLARRQKELRRGPTPPVAELRVREVMNAQPICTTPEMDLHELRRLMIRERQRYLPVLDGGRLVGVVSFHDVARRVFEAQEFENRMLKSYIRDWPQAEEA